SAGRVIAGRNSRSSTVVTGSSLIERGDGTIRGPSTSLARIATCDKRRSAVAMGQSSVGPSIRRRHGIAFVDYPRTAGLPAITVERGAHLGGGAVVPGPHAHDFLVLLYLEAGELAAR